MGPRLRGQGEAGRGRLPPDDEVELRQLPRELHPGRHEAREGQGRARAGLRAHAGRAGVLRLRGHARPGGLTRGICLREIKGELLPALVGRAYSSRIKLDAGAGVYWLTPMRPRTLLFSSSAVIDTH